MKLAVISDVHADVHALRDALVQIAALGIEQIVCCGDLVDYGLFPEETLKLLCDRNVICIRGNHDRWAVMDGADTTSWDLTPARISFLRSLPVTWSANIEGVRVVLWHAQPNSDMNGIDPRSTTSQEFASMLDRAEADVLLVGHTHVGYVRQLGMMRMVANPGALLRDPADGMSLPTPGTFGVLTIEHERARFEVRRARDGIIVAGIR
jgi:putative phosphoesterase